MFEKAESVNSIADRPVAITRVLHLASGDLWAGAEVQLYHLARHLNAMADIVLLVVVLNEGELQRRLGAAGVRVQVLDESKYGFLALLTRLVSISRRYRPDVIHTHREKENLLGSLASIVVRGGRSVRTAHGIWEHRPRFWEISKRLQLLADRWAGRYLQRNIVCVSEELKMALLAIYPARKLLVIENGVDVDMVRQSAAQGAADVGNRFNVVFAGRMMPVKRVDLFVEIARLTELAYPGKFCFYALGDGPDMAAAVKTAEEAGLGNIVFTGFRFDLLTWLGAMDALCITSDREGLPMVLLEAMALKVPVISRRVGGIGPVLDSGNAGVLIESADANLFVEALNRLRMDSDYSTSLASVAWLEVNEKFSAIRMAQKYQALYRNSCQGRGGLVEH